MSSGLRSSDGDVNEISTSSRLASRLERMVITFCSAAASDCSACTNRLRNTCSSWPWEPSTKSDSRAVRSRTRIPVAFQSPSRNSIRLRSSAAHIHGARVHLFGRGVRNQARDHAGGLGSLRRDGQYLALRRTAVRLVERLIRQAR